VSTKPGQLQDEQVVSAAAMVAYGVNDQGFREVLGRQEDGGGEAPRKDHEAQAALVVTVEIMWQPKRWPVPGTTGVCPRLPQVRPAWWSERTPISSPQ